MPRPVFASILVVSALVGGCDALSSSAVDAGESTDADYAASSDAATDADVATQDLAPGDGPSTDGGGNTSPAGWTVFTPSADSRVVYVSINGNDQDDGLSETTPKSLTGGIALLRDGFPDWLLLKKGETYPRLSAWAKSGRSASEPMVISSYGVGDRPILIGSGDQAAFGFGGTRHDLALVDLALHGPSDYALDFLGNGENLWLEGVEISGATSNRIQGLGGRFSHVTIRRCAFFDNVGDSHSQGLYVERTDDLVFEENVVDHNGWVGTDANQFAQGLYVHQSSGPALVRNNIFSRTAHGGLQQRSGGTMEFNLGVDNAVSFQLGHNETTSDNTPPYQATGVMRYNVATLAHDLVSAQGPRGHGFWLANTVNASATENLATHLGGAGRGVLYSIENSTGATISDSLAFDWYRAGDDLVEISSSSGTTQTNIDTSRANPALGNGSYPDPARALASYASSVGIAGTVDALLLRARQNQKTNWDERFTATAIIRYLRAGFGKTTP